MTDPETRDIQVAAVTLRRRAMLLHAYRSAVVNEARARGLDVLDFGEAMLALPRDVFQGLKDAYAEQVRVLEVSYDEVLRYRNILGED